MRSKRLTIQFCGFGGQGIILSSVVLGTAAVIKGGLNAVQTQSYGSEARGGECQAELILSPDVIQSPISDRVDILVAMSQPALRTYLPRLVSGGLLIYDPELVQTPERSDLKAVAVPASHMAAELGLKLSANMFMLGFIQEVTRLVTADELLEVVRTHVPQKYAELNQKSAQQGMELAKTMGLQVEV